MKKKKNNIENKDKEIIQIKTNHSRENAKTDEMPTFLKEEEILENRSETLLRLDDSKIGQLAAEINQNTYRVWKKERAHHQDKQRGACNSEP